MKMLENKWILSIGSLVISLLSSFIVIFIINKIIKLTSKRVALNSKLFRELKLPIRLAIMLLGIFIANFYVNSDFIIDGINLIVLYKIAATFIFVYALIKIIKASFVWYVKKLKENDKVVDDTIFHFLNRVITVILYFIGVLIALSLLGIEVKPILAGLGIAGLAVAFALQDTLGNFFSAIYLVADQPVKIGDYIKIASTGEEGYVSDIGWRSTRLRTREHNVIIIPNVKLAQSVITNYNQVQTRSKVEISLGISYNSDLDLVEKITNNTAKKIMKEFQPGITDFEPYIRFEQFADSSINLKTALMSENVEARFVLIHEFIKELMKAYRKNKIEIPYPQRDIHITK